MIKKTIHCLLISMISLMFSGAVLSKAYADDLFHFSNLFIFGDSLSDVGNISGAPYTNRNTDNSANIWANDLGNYFGWKVSASNAGGNDFAEAGAVTGDLGFDTHSTADSVDVQIQHYLSASGGHVDKNALYAIWAGGNDVRDYFEYGLFSITPSQLIANSTGNIVNIVNALHQAGAKYIIVPNIPNFANTPVVNNDPIYKALQAQISALVHAYNTQLLASLNATGDNIIQIDMAGMFDAIQANYAKFGFTGPLSEVTCDPLSGVVCKDPNGAIFNGDGLHPSQATHSIAADYMLSVLEGPELDALLEETPLAVMDVQNKQIQSELSALQSGLTSLTTGHWHVFVSGAYNTAHKEADGLENPGYHQDNTAFTVGADYRLSAQSVLGFAVGRSIGKVSQSSDTSNFKFDLDENLLNIFGGMQFLDNKAYLNGSLGYGSIDDSNIHRSFMLGIFPEVLYGHTTGDHYDAEMTAGYLFAFLNKRLQTGPMASLEFQRVSINPYAEHSSNVETEGTAFDALQYAGSQHYDSFVGGLGWQLSYTAMINNINVKPYLQASYNHEMINDNSVEAGLTSLAGSHFELPVGLPFKDYGLFSGGVQAEFQHSLVMSVGYDAMAGHRYLSQNMMLNVSLPF